MTSRENSWLRYFLGICAFPLGDPARAQEGWHGPEQEVGRSEAWWEAQTVQSLWTVSSSPHTDPAESPGSWGCWEALGTAKMLGARSLHFKRAPLNKIYQCQEAEGDVTTCDL